MAKAKTNARSVLQHTQKLVSDGKSTVDLPRELESIFREELYKEWTTSTGKRFGSFSEALTARQPYGLGIGQYHGWLTAMQAHALCQGRKELQLAIRPAVGSEVVDLPKNGRPKKGAENSDNVRVNAFGNSVEYLLAKLKRDAPAVFKEWQEGKHASVRRAAIAAGIIKVDSDKSRCPVDRIKMYWKRTTASQRAELLLWMKANEGVKRRSNKKGS
jgi:hypothetical protein